MSAKKVPRQVHIDYAAPPRFVSFKEMKHRSDKASVVYQNFDMSPMRLHLIKHGTNLFAASYIARNRYR
jgi:hypothetical protein